MRDRLRNAGAAIARVLDRELGTDEILIATALALIDAALWPQYGRLSLVVPGAVLLWIALPQRATFFTPSARPPTDERKG
jgi:hypothetical protein